MSKVKFKQLRFEYCECGCKGSASKIEGFDAGWGPHFWIYDDLKGNHELYRGHGRYGAHLGTFKDYKKAYDKANDSFQADIQKLLA